MKKFKKMALAVSGIALLGASNVNAAVAPVGGPNQDIYFGNPAVKKISLQGSVGLPAMGMGIPPLDVGGNQFVVVSYDPNMNAINTVGLQMGQYGSLTNLSWAYLGDTNFRPFFAPGGMTPGGMNPIQLCFTDTHLALMAPLPPGASSTQVRIVDNPTNPTFDYILDVAGVQRAPQPGIALSLMNVSMPANQHKVSQVNVVGFSPAGELMMTVSDGQGNQANLPSVDLRTAFNTSSGMASFLKNLAMSGTPGITGVKYERNQMGTEIGFTFPPGAAM